MVSVRVYETDLLYYEVKSKTKSFIKIDNKWHFLILGEVKDKEALKMLKMNEIMTKEVPYKRDGKKLKD